MIWLLTVEIDDEGGGEKPGAETIFVLGMLLPLLNSINPHRTPLDIPVLISTPHTFFHILLSLSRSTCFY